jgi:flagellar basal body rod protein FlgB
MLFGFVDRTTSATSLKQALDENQARVRGIQSRVARASLNGDGFALTSASQGPRVPGDGVSGPVDVEAEMVALADEQLRFEATAKLLEKAYASLKSAIRDR